MCNCCGGSEEVVALNVEGMSCGHCKMAVEKAVNAVDGVSKVEVDLAGKTVTVTYKSEKTNEGAIKEAIEDQGYDIV